jgi:hypothetical protein
VAEVVAGDAPGELAVDAGQLGRSSEEHHAVVLAEDAARVWADAIEGGARGRAQRQLAAEGFLSTSSRMMSVVAPVR